MWLDGTSTSPLGEKVTAETARTDREKELSGEIMNFCRHLAGSLDITAVCVGGSHVFQHRRSRTVDVLLIIAGFPSRIMSYMKSTGNRTIRVLAVDQGLFENDVERGVAGEALAQPLILPYAPLLNGSYLFSMEIKLKKRMIEELLGNLVLEFPELSRQLRIEPEYFLSEIVLIRARLFPPLVRALDDFMKDGTRSKLIGQALEGFMRALEELQKEGKVYIINSFIRISDDFAERTLKRRTHLADLFRPTQRALFTSLLTVFQNILSSIPLTSESPLETSPEGNGNGDLIRRFEDPENHVFVPTASGLIPLASRIDVRMFATRILKAEEDAEISVERLGGVLNDVYLVRVVINGNEQKVVAKNFRDWSNFKWFPLTLWSIGTRTFTVSALSRLEKEVGINEFLRSKGFAVPAILCASPAERLVFMEYVEGQHLSDLIKRIAVAENVELLRDDLQTLEMIGRLFAKVHSLGVT